MKRILQAGIILLLTSFILASCDSSLSDISLDDPSLINANFVIETAISDTEEQSYATALLTDKNFAFVQLKDGELLINDTKMNWLGFSRIYSLDLTVHENTQYIFTIKLADGKEYNSVVRTPMHTFKGVGAPNSVTTSDDITITWSDYNPEGTIKIIFETWNNTMGQKAIIYQGTVTDDGRYTIDNSSMNYPNKLEANFENTYIRLIRETTGELNSSLRGGNIVSRFIYSRDINIKD